MAREFLGMADQAVSKPGGEYNPLESRIVDSSFQKEYAHPPKMR
jgi:hypothetical protein